MNDTFLNLALPGIRDLAPYQPGKPISELQREYGLEQVVKLASNENPLGPSQGAIQAGLQAIAESSRYPDGNGFELKQALSRVLSIAPEQLTLGNGSNDVLELIARAFGDHNSEIIFSQYAFAVYPLVTQAIGAKAVVTPAKDWGHDLDAMVKALSAATKVIFVANPNNPTGTWFGHEALLRFLEKIPSKVIVVLDEAYFEYAADKVNGAADYPQALPLLEQFPNLIICRTFSKAYGLAGLRVGYSISHPQVADVLNRIRQPFNVNLPALAMAAAALDDIEHLNKAIQCNQDGMRQLCAGFESLGLEYIPSCGNFISVKVGMNPLAIYEGLLRQGVIVRPVNNYGMTEYLRVSIGLESENQIFLKALAQVLSSANES